MRELLSGIDELVPRPDASERHHALVHAGPDVTLDAFRRLTLREMPLAALLFGIRSLPARLAGSPGLPAVLSAPVLWQFTKLGFSVLVDRPGQELVVGVVAQMWTRHGKVVRPRDAGHFAAFDEPGFVKAAMSFRVAAEGGGVTRAVTETRAVATDAAARRAFRRYWLLIRPFSGLIRRDWLRAVAVRAERAEGQDAEFARRRATARVTTDRATSLIGRFLARVIRPDRRSAARCEPRYRAWRTLSAGGNRPSAG